MMHRVSFSAFGNVSNGRYEKIGMGQGMWCFEGVMGDVELGNILMRLRPKLRDSVAPLV